MRPIGSIFINNKLCCQDICLYLMASKTISLNHQIDVMMLKLCVQLQKRITQGHSEIFFFNFARKYKISSEKE